MCLVLFFFSSRRRHTRCSRDWSSDVCSSDLHHDFVALFPFLHQLRNQRRRILQVGRHADHRLALRLQQRVIRRADMSEITRIDDDLDVAVLCRERAQTLHCAVGRGVVDEDVLVRVARQRGDRVANLLVQFFDVLLFVVAAGDDADERHQSAPFTNVRIASATYSRIAAVSPGYTPIQKLRFMMTSVFASSPAMRYAPGRSAAHCVTAGWRTRLPAKSIRVWIFFDSRCCTIWSRVNGASSRTVSRNPNQLGSLCGVGSGRTNTSSRSANAWR